MPTTLHQLEVCRDAIVCLGPNWTAALAAGQSAIPVMDGLLALGGLASVVSAGLALRRREQPTFSAGAIMQSAE